jgi:hypothetical protein
LVASLARPGGNATGINFLNQETVAKQLTGHCPSPPDGKPGAPGEHQSRGRSSV